MALALGSSALCNPHLRAKASESLPRSTSRISARISTPTIAATKGVSTVCEPFPPDRPLCLHRRGSYCELDGSLRCSWALQCFLCSFIPLKLDEAR